MATHSSILAWRIPWTEEPGGLQSIRSQRVGHIFTTKPPPPASPVTGKLVGDTWGKRWGPSEEKVGTGVKQPQAKGKATRPWKTKDLTSPRASGGSMALPLMLDFSAPELREEYTAAILSHQVRGNLLWHPWATSIHCYHVFFWKWLRLDIFLWFYWPLEFTFL